jgi:hemin uptake protein HemP
VIDEPVEVRPLEQAAGESTVRIASSEVFRGQRKVVIIHQGTEYRLLITKSNKLILTK